MARLVSFVRTPLLLAGFLIAAALVLHGLPTSGAGFGVWARGQGRGWFVVMAALACAVGVPRQAACFAAGYAFGPLEGGVLALLAETTGCLTDMVWARAVARRWVRRRFGHRLARMDRVLERRPFGATLCLRLLPVGNNLLLNFAAGVSLVPVVPFVLASAIGYVPQTAVFVLLGAGVGVRAGAQVLLAGVLFLASLVVGVFVVKARPGALPPSFQAGDPAKGTALRTHDGCTS